MNNIKLKKGRAAYLGSILVRGLPVVKKPKHTPKEIATICGQWVSTLGGGKEFIPGYTRAQMKKRSRNRARNRIAKASRRRNRI